MKKVIKKAICTGLIAVVVGLSGCSKKYHDSNAVARFYDAAETGFPVSTMESSLYQGYDQDGNGSIDHIAKDRFALLSGRTWVSLGRENLTESDGVKFSKAKEILEAKLQRDQERRDLAKEIYGANGIADSDGNGVIGYNEFVDMYQQAGLEDQIVGFSQYKPRKTEELQQINARWGKIEEMQQIVNAYQSK